MNRKGFFLVVAAYTLWGVLPLFWKYLKDFPPEHVLFFRTLFAMLCLLTAVMVRGEAKTVSSLVRDRTTLKQLLCSAALLGVNWYSYLEAIRLGMLSEASLGYFICPLLSVLLGSFVLREQMSTADRLGMLLIGAGVATRILSSGHLPFLGLVIALSFSLYSLFRKRAGVPAIPGSLVETAVLTPLTFMIAYHSSASAYSIFPESGDTRWLLYVCAGVLTAVPMVMLVAGLRSVELRIAGLVQYVSPTLSLLVATLAFGESFSEYDAVCFACVWGGIALSVGGERMVSWFTRRIEGPGVKIAARAV